MAFAAPGIARALGMVAGTWIAASRELVPVWEVPLLGVTTYTASVALALNLVVATLLTLALAAAAGPSSSPSADPLARCPGYGSHVDPWAGQCRRRGVVFP